MTNRSANSAELQVWGVLSAIEPLKRPIELLERSIQRRAPANAGQVEEPMKRRLARLRRKLAPLSAKLMRSLENLVKIWKRMSKGRDKMYDRNKVYGFWYKHIMPFLHRLDQGPANFLVITLEELDQDAPPPEGRWPMGTATIHLPEAGGTGAQWRQEHAHNTRWMTSLEREGGQ